MDRLFADPGLRRAASVGLLIAVWVPMVAVSVFAVYWYAHINVLGNDAHAYWLAGNVEHPYEAAPNTSDAFLYTPAFRQLVWPLAQLPWPAFLAVWIAAEATAFAWLVRPLPWRWAVPLWLLAVPEILTGNVLGFLCVTLVLGITRSWPWPFHFLTKMIPGGLGLAYLAASGERRKAAVAVGVTAALGAVSFLLAPGLWLEWFEFMSATESSWTVPVRALLGLALAAAAARLRRPWLLAPAMLISTPVLSLHAAYYSMLLAIPRLVPIRGQPPRINQLSGLPASQRRAEVELRDGPHET